MDEKHLPSSAAESDVGFTVSDQTVHAKAVYNAELYAALQEHEINLRGKESFRLYFAIFVAFCCACAIGYDGSLMTGIIAMKHFQETFHSGTTGTHVSIIYSFYTVGSMVGAPFAAILSDRYGRLRAMFYGGAVIIVGMIIAATAATTSQFVVGRAIVGVGTAFMSVSAPSYCLEIAMPHWRGRFTGFFNVGWYGGSIPAAIINFGCNYIDSNYSWRIPVIFQALGSVIVMSCVFFLPESPRYLMANGRELEAEDFIVKYHGNGRRDSPLVLLEIHEMKQCIRQDGIDKRSFDYRPLLLTHSGRWRLAQVLMMAIFGQFSGNGLGYFNTVIFANLGINSVPQQLAYNIIHSVVGLVATLASLCVIDRIARRKLLVLGSLACALTLAINSGLSAALYSQDNHVQKSYAKGALAAYFLFAVVFGFTYTPLQSIVPTEALETTTRAKGMAIYNLAVGASSFINQFCGPIGLGNMGYKYIYIFVGWNVVEAILWYFFGVEAQGRTLEQLEWVYQQSNPVKASLEVDEIEVRSDGKVVNHTGHRRV